MDNKNIQKKLKQLRKESGLTQKQLAEYLGVDQSQISRLENGARKVNLTLVMKICCLFGCDESCLTGDAVDSVPMNFAFDSEKITAEDLRCVELANRIVLDIRYMNRLSDREAD